MIPIALTTNAAAVIKRIDTFPARMGQGIAAALDRENELTVGAIVQDNLSYPADTKKTPEHGLRVHTSRLRRSVRPLRAVVGATEIRSAIGSNVRYAGVHEYGFSGTVTVRAHVRRNPAGDVFGSKGAVFNRSTGKITKAKSTQLLASGITTVRQHSMKMNMRARFYIWSKLEERTARYGAAVSAAIELAWDGGQS